MGPDRQKTAREQGTGIAVDDLAADARRLSLEDFEQAHGDAFLMLGSLDLDAPGGPAATVVAWIVPDETEAECLGPFDPLVHPVRRTGRSVGHLISVGRTSNNDVVVPDVSVSRFHAFLKEATGDARWSIQDAGSTNGTAVNGRPVPAQGKGGPVDLKSGDRVRVGQVELTFFEAELLVRLLQGRR